MTLFLLIASALGSLWVVSHYWNAGKQKTDNVTWTAFTPDDNLNILNSMTQDIRGARQTIYIMAKQLTSLELMHALLDARTRRVTIYVILDSQQQRVYNYLMENGFTSTQVYLDPSPINSQYMIIDQSLLIVGTVPFSSQGQREVGDVEFTKDPARVQSYTDTFGTRVKALAGLTGRQQ